MHQNHTLKVWAVLKNGKKQDVAQNPNMYASQCIFFIIIIFCCSLFKMRMLELAEYGPS